MALSYFELHRSENKAIPGKRLDGPVLDVVINRLLTRDFTSKLLAAINMQLVEPDLDTRVSQLQSRLRSVDRTIADLLDLAEKSRRNRGHPVRAQPEARGKTERLRQKSECFRSREMAQITGTFLLGCLRS